MARIKGALGARKRHNRTLKLAKGAFSVPGQWQEPYPP